MNKETPLINKILGALASRPDTRLWRNVTAHAWVGKKVGQFGPRVVLDPAQPIQAGLCKGSADIIGLHKGRFVAMEVKTGKQRPTTPQKRFLAMVRSQGGIAGVVRSVEDATKLLEGED